MNQPRSSTLTGDKRALLNAFLRDEGMTSAQVAGIPRRKGKDIPPLSFAQQRLWFLDQLVPGNPFYNCDTIMPIPALIKPHALQRSIDTIVTRHESLRTVFREVDGKPIQHVLTTLSVPVEQIDLRPHPLKGRRAEAYRLAREEALKPFRLDEGPLIRVKLITLGDADHLLVLIMHHIISDGWSLGIFSRELQTCYAAYCLGREPLLGDLPIQYADFTLWQRAFLEGERLERLLEYWRHKLQGLSELPLLTDRKRPAFPTFEGAFEKVVISAEVTRRLKLLAQSEGATPFMLLLAAFKVLLARYSQAEDVVVGSPIANRNRAELEGLIGFFVNTLVLRTSLAGRPTFRELLRRVKQTALEAYAHQDLPFEALVDDIQPERDLSRNPLFQVTFQFFSIARSPGDNGSPPPQTGAGLIEVQRGTSKFDLRLDMWETESGFGGQFEYSLDLFQESTVQRMIAQFTRLLMEVVHDPDRAISDLPLVDKATTLSVVRTWNETARVYPRERNVFELFQDQAHHHPDDPAVSFGAQTWSYRNLAGKADQVAGALTSAKVDCGEKIGICLNRSPEFIAAMLGILKCGCAYVPIDPEFPEARKEFILTDSGARCVIGREDTGFVSPPDCTLLGIESILNGHQADGATLAPASRGGSDPAYVMYTSGSTGIPKGVLIPHRGINRLVRATNYIEIRSQDRIAHLSNVAFDASTFEIWGALLNGATLVGIERDVALSPADLKEALLARRVSVAFLTTALFHQIADELPDTFASLRLLLVGGSDSDPERFAKVLQGSPPAQLQHVYGPTENTTFSTFYPLPPVIDASRRIPIGRPLANSTAFILDGDRQPVPVGVPGELYVGGDGLALGYLNRPELDQAAFITHSLAAGGKLYRTGDRARYLEGGDIEFLGRMDNQVKIRGFRVELSEIETVLRRHPAVKEAIALLRHDDGEREPRIGAYVSLQDPAAAPQGPDGSASAEHVLVDQWRRIYDQVIYGGLQASTPSSGSPTFNTTGWKDSYTGETLGEAVMREQVAQSVARILDGAPRRVLEIGCGTGLLMHSLLPRVDRYVGTDFSESALHSLRSSLAAVPVEAPKVELFVRDANDFSGFAPASFDLVVLNSIVQYFPSVAYLEDILRQALQVLTPSGRIFIGDVRALPLLEALHLSVVTAQSEAELDLASLRHRLLSRLDREQELCIHPMFFLEFSENCPGLTGVVIQQKRGRLDCELTRYRFDVVLYGSRQPAPRREYGVRAWDSIGSMAVLAGALQDKAVLPLRVTGIPNQRLERDRALCALLEARDLPDVRTLRERLQASYANQSVHPEEIWSLAETMGLQSWTCWTNGRETEAFDAWFFDASDVGLVQFPSGAERKLAHHERANDPVKGRFFRNIVPELREFVQRILPEYMHPARYVLVPEFPLNANGKIDLKKLPAPDKSRARDGLDFVKPRNELEERLASIFTKVLGIDALDVNDNFFTNLGGNSLLATQVISQVQLQMKVKVPLRLLFEAPTVAAFRDRVEGCLRNGPPEMDAITVAPAQPVALDVEGLSDQEVDRLLQDLLGSQTP